MKKFFVVFLLMAVFLSGCAKEQDPEPVVLRESEDYYAVYAGEMTTFDYLVTNSAAEYDVLANCVDTLVEYNHLGVMQPGLATDWSCSDDGLVWTFKIREGAVWVTHEGEEYGPTTAHDFVNSLKYSFNPDNGSRSCNIAYSILKNGTEYYTGEITDFSQVGVKAVDDYTLEYTLVRPCPYFLTMLTYNPFMPLNGDFLAEIGEENFGTDNTTVLYNGAYIVTEWEPQDYRIMVKNEKYWDAEHVYIKQLNYKYNKEAGTLAPELFLRGDITGAGIPTAALDEWFNDPVKKDLIRPSTTSFYSYWYLFNFDPQYDDEYEPDNWRIVVNNKNFRKSMFHALDRYAAMLTADPYAPERKLNNTITPKNFCSYGGKDFTQIGDLAKWTNTESFDPDLALEYKAKALEELQGKAKFPVIVKMPYNTGNSDWTQRSQVVEQQMENLLGKDYIDIIPVGYPSTNFLTVTRRSGNYAFEECNWGPDYADPETWTDPWAIDPEGNSKYHYNFIEFAEEYIDPETGEHEYFVMLEEAKAEVTDIGKRYELFANLEAWWIEQAFGIPYGVGGGGYVASKLEPFTSPYAPFGLSNAKLKHQVVMEKPMNTEEWTAAYEKWQQDRDAALAEAGQ
jgi:oligopeptide transport system substrate-binding protein